MTGRDHSRVAIAASDYNKEKNYWLKKLSGELQKSCFPYDHAKGASPTAPNRQGVDHTGETVEIHFTGDVFRRMIKISRDSDYVLHMILAGGVITLLFRYTGDNDVLLGTPIYKQEKEADFLNTVLPLRVQLHEQMNFKELLVQVRQTMVEANENQNYPMETLLFQLNIPTSEEEFPLFDTAVLLENIHHKKYIRDTHPNIIFSFLRTPEEIHGQVEYNTLRYEHPTAARIANYFKRLVEKAIFSVELPLGKIDLLSDWEREQLLVEFNDTARDYPAAKTIDELFVDQAARTPGQIALTYDGEPITYSRLEEEAGALAAYLRSIGLKTEEPAALMVENSYLVIVAILGILKAGGAYLPINTDYPQERKKYILDDCNTSCLLTNCPGSLDYAPQVMVIQLDDSGFAQHKAGEFQGGRISHTSGSLAYIMYTSGSTGTPRGVMVTHGNAVRLVKNTNFVEFNKGDSILLTGALEFDASTFEIWGALLNGLILHLVNKDTILNHDKLKQVIRQSNVTTMWMTAPLFNQMLDADIEIFTGLKNLLVGGDVLSPYHINRLRKRFPGLTIINGYGPTENTTFSTTFRIDKEYKESIPIGKPIANSLAYILDKAHLLVPIGIVGELYVGGDGLSRGYLNNPELTAEKFLATEDTEGTEVIFNQKLLRGVQRGGFLEKSPSGRRRQNLYKTGDLARWFPDGNIEFLGRLDHQVKIRGYRIEPGEIESYLVQMEMVKEAVVVDRKKGDGEKYLCAYVVPGEGQAGILDTGELRKVLSVRLPDYMVPAYFICLEEIPLTSNGKVDRKALPEPRLSLSGADYAPPRNPVEEKFVEIWAEVLKIEKTNIGIDSDFFELGGHSLKATILISKLHKTFNVKVPLAQLFMAPTIRELAEYIKESAQDIFLSLKISEKKEYYQLSSAQKRLYILQQMKLDSIGYNIPQVMVLEGELSKEKLEETFKKLIQRHESLRTSFHMIHQEPVQRIHDEVQFEIEYYDSGRQGDRETGNENSGRQGDRETGNENSGREGERETGNFLKNSGRQGSREIGNESSPKTPLSLSPSLPEFIKDFTRPFDLSQAPLLRVRLIKVRDQQHIFMVDIHHIVTDGTSMELLEKEFIVLYAGKELSALRFQYKDYAEWQNSEPQRESIKKQEEYWLNCLAGEIPVLDLPEDYPRPQEQSFAGSIVQFRLEAEPTAALYRLAAENGATLYMVTLALYTILLFKLSGQEDIIVGTPIAGRRHDDLERIIGMFVNTLAIRNYPQGEKTFHYFLNEVKQRALEAFENQDYQFELLVEQVMVSRDTSRNPLFDTLLTLPNMEAPLEEIPRASTENLRVKPYGNEITTTKFDLELSCWEAGQVLIFTFLYCTKLFKPETIERFIGYFKRIVSAVIEEPGQRIWEIEIMSEPEKTQLLIDFNDTHCPYPQDKTLHELFADQVDRTPDNTALVGIHATHEKHKKNSYLSYKELNQKSHQLALFLKEKGVRPDTIVGIMTDRSMEMIVGLLAILKAGGAYLPIDPEYPQERIDYMLKDSNAKILLTRQEIANLSFHLHLSPWVNAPVTSLAYIIYTSGSTGKPKGVAVEHQNITNVLSWFARKYNLQNDTHLLLMHSYTFDPSVNQIFGTLLNGAVLYIIDKASMGDIQLLRRCIEKYQIHIINFVPTVLKYLLGHDKKLQSVRLVLSGAEKLDEKTKDEIIEKGYRLYNQYGPTETTIDAVVGRCSAAKVTLGQPISNVQCYIFDKYNCLTPVGVAGELGISGAGVTRGYLNRPELTQEYFVPNPFAPGKPMYRSGDLVKWLPDGNIEFLGRVDHQVKIRGYRIEPGEIETQLLTHEKVKEAVVIMHRRGINGVDDGYLCAYVVLAEGAATGELKDYLSAALPAYMIPAYFVEIDQIPLTPNGKIHRSALPQPEIRGEKAYVAPRDRIEKKLAEIWEEVLSRGTAGASLRIGIHDDLFALGGHSLTATVIVSRAHKELQVKVPLVEIFKTPTIAGLARYIKNAPREMYAAIQAVEKKEYYVLSSAQKRLYILQQMDLQSTAYNMPEMIPLNQRADKEKLEETFKQLILRHESLRTSFHMINEEPVQRVHDEVEFEIEYYDSGRQANNDSGRQGERETGNLLKSSGREASREIGSESSPKTPVSLSPSLPELSKDFIRPFDLSQAPLLRVRLINLGEKGHLLMIDMHHIISDGISHDILVKDYMTLYDGKALPPLRIQYKDFSHWQNSEKETENLKQQETYWLKKFAGEIPVLNLPTDFLRPAVQSFAGDSENFEIPASETAALKSIALAEGSTLYMVLLAVFNVLLFKLSSQEEIVIGTPVAGRRHADLEPIIGMFINTLAMRSFPHGAKTFKAFLADVKEATLEDFENQEYPFEDLVEKVSARRDASRNPLFDVMFTLQNFVPVEERGSDEQSGDEQESFFRISKFDMTLAGIETANHLRFSLQYCTKLFKRETIQRFTAYFKTIVSLVGKDPLRELRQIDILSAEERSKILNEFNNTSREYPGEKTIHELFAHQARQTPDRTAVVRVGPSCFISYGHLQQKSLQLAGTLKKRGMQPDNIAAIMAEKSIETLVGILGILKAGGAYLFINPNYPNPRKEFLLKDSCTRILLSPHRDMIFEGIQTLCLNEPAVPGENVDVEDTASPGSLAYIMYTSGSSGTPKGVMVEHRNVVRLVKNTNYLEFREKDRLLQTGALEFDASTLEIWGPLLNGLELLLADREILLSAGKLKETLLMHNISTIWMTSPLFNRMVDADIEIFQSLRNLLVGGDVLSPVHINKLRERYPHLAISNGYGPTENTTFSTTHLIDKNYSINIPIGKPIANSTAYIVDTSNHLVPIGVRGELVVGGDGIARGYLNNPELTAEKFFSFSYKSYTSYMTYISNKIYKTGDLARWLPDGNIEFSGRKDQQVKIRGFRIEPGEIKSYLLNHEAIRDAVVITAKSGAVGGFSQPGEDKFICAYLVAEEEKEFSTTEIREYLASHLPDYMVPSFYIRIDNVPLTPNGKVDVRALPEPELEAGAEYIAPRSALEIQLVELWSGVLEIKKEIIGIDSDFFQLGGHSLKATVLVARIHKELNVKIPLVEIFKTPTIRELAAYIKTSAEEKYAAIEPVEKREYYALSSAQKRLYILQQMDLASTAYNMPEMIPLNEEADRVKLEETFKQLILRHESLRTSFHMINEEPVQRVHDEVEFEIEYYDSGRQANNDSGRQGERERGNLLKSSGREASREIGNKEDLPNTDLLSSEHSPKTPVSLSPSLPELSKDFIGPFDLSLAPLLRVRLVNLAEKGHLLMIDMHHIISDGLSHEILVKDYLALYEGVSLPPLRIQYKDFSLWQNNEKEKEDLKKQEAYWLKEFKQDIPVLNLFTDYMRPIVQGFAGNIVGFAISADESNALKTIALETHSTLFMVLLAVFNSLLAKLSGQEDIVVGTPIAGRRHADLEKIIGMFVNTLALRNYPVGSNTFAGFLAEIKKRTLQSFENQEYQFEDLVDILEVKRDISRNPLFDIMFSMHNFEDRLETADSNQEQHQFKETRSKFDMSLTAVESKANLFFYLTYNTALYKKETIENFIGYFRMIVSSVIRQENMKLYQIEIMSETARRQVLYDFNNASADYPRHKTLQQWFAGQAEETPHHVALVGVQETQEKHEKNYNMSYTSHISYLSYKELNQKSHQLALLLKEKGVRPDTLVGIMTDRSPEMIIGILGILKAGGAYMPIDPGYPQERIDYMLKDSSAGILLTRQEIVNLSSPEAFNNHSKGASFHLHLSPWINAPVTSLAYIIYTSGTTGKPKGVLIQHKSVINLVTGLSQRVYNFNDTKSVKVSLISPYVFDASVKQIFSALLLGHTLVIVPEEARLDAEKLLRFYKANDIQVADGTPLHLGMILNYKTGLESDFPVKKLVIGGEPLGTELSKQLLETINQHDFQLINVYGPTECCDVTTSYSVTAEAVKTQQPLPIGTPLPNVKVYVLGNYGELQVRGVPGELYIAGDGLARGYLNNPELTAEKFFSISHKSYTSYMTYISKKIYKTGDLVRWLVDGNIEFLGRIDRQVKIRGYRIELGEIENQLLKHTGIKEVVVLDREVGEKYLCAYIVPNAPDTLERIVDIGIELRKFLSAALPDYMIPSYFVKLEKIPLTPSGKVDGKALPLPEVRSKAPYIAPRDHIEAKLAVIWAEVLEPDHDQTNPLSVGIDDNFFALGGHSLKATIMTAKIHKELNVIVPLAEVFKTPTVRGLARYIKGRPEERYAAIEPIEKKDYYVLSSAQKRLYILQQMDPASTAYNMPEMIPLTEEADRPKLEETFKRLIDRHESLRTSFHMTDEEPVQRVHDEVEFEIEYYDSGRQGDRETGRQGDRQIENELSQRTPLSLSPSLPEYFTHPFDLSRAPLLRVQLVNLGEKGHLLMIDMHHIISDGISHSILVKDYMALYDGEILSPLRIQYKDFSQWQDNEKEKDILKKQESYWLKEFAGDIPVLNLPGDYVRPAVQSFAGNTLRFHIPVEETAALKNLALDTHSTLFMVLLAMFNILLAKLGSQEDIVVGTPIAGRRHADMEKIIGMFVNTLALRNFPGGEQPFKEFLRALKTRTLQAFENQEYPFEDLVEKAAVNRDASRNPIFDVMFALNRLETGDRATPAAPNATAAGTSAEEREITTEPSHDYENRTAKFDLTLTALDAGEELFFSFQYCTRLFQAGTLQRFILYFKKIVSSVIRDPALRLGELEILSAEEKQQLLYDFNDTLKEYPLDKTLHQVFAEQVARTPDNICIIFHDRQLTYRELNQKSNQLAGVLREKGVKPGSIVGVLLNRCPELLIGILGILKSGSAYLPMDPQYPPERLKFMLKESDSKVLLTQGHLTPGFVETGVMIDVEDEGLYKGEGVNPVQAVTPGQIAYIIYTSGSTGIPRGVAVEHASVVNLVFYQKEWFEFEPGDRVLQFSSISFDASLEQIFTTFFSGAGLVLIDKESLLHQDNFSEFVLRHCIAHIHAVPSFLSVVTLSPYPGLKRVVSGGDVCPLHLARKWYKHVEFYNEYGPTETTVTSIQLQVENLEESLTQLPLGKPLANTSVYVLDRWGKPVPSRVMGELYIGGAGVAAGYLNNPERTRESFRFNPFSPGRERLYRTGDICRWLMDGNLEFYGRMDRQVKIRGFRVELGEIESHLLKREEIKEAAVIGRKGKEGNEYLCAYIVPQLDTDTAPMNETAYRAYLSHLLPDYMIPAYFVVIEKIPLTPSGKIDWEALPIPRIETITSAYIAPRDGLERRLVEIWSAILEVKIEFIGITSNFFQLGGHSLSATIMAAKVHKEFKVNVPLLEVFRTPTVKHLAEFVRSKGKGIFSIKDDNLVLLNIGKTDHHLFIIHDSTGDVNTFMKFCQHLTIGFNCWGLQADKIVNYTPQKLSVKDIARKYIEKIKKVQPPGQGPYFIAGWSIGGTIAFEMARQLEEENQEIAFLGVIDSKAPSRLLWLAEWLGFFKFTLRSEIRYIKYIFIGEEEIKKLLKKVKKVDYLWPETVKILETYDLDEDSLKGNILRFGGQILPNFERLSVRDCIYYLNMGRSQATAARKFIPTGKINAPVYFFKAQQSNSRQLKEKHWKKYSRTSMKFYETPGNHFTLFVHPHVLQLAEVFDRAVNEAQKELKIDHPGIKKRKNN